MEKDDNRIEYLLIDVVIKIFDELGENTTNEIREKMLDVFYKSTFLEWHFWNDAYNLAV